MTRVLVTATSPTIRAGVRALLAGYADLTVLEAPGRPGQLADLADTVEADVVLLALERIADQRNPFEVGDKSACDRHSIAKAQPDDSSGDIGRKR